MLLFNWFFFICFVNFNWVFGDLCFGSQLLVVFYDSVAVFFLFAAPIWWFHYFFCCQTVTCFALFFFSKTTPIWFFFFFFFFQKKKKKTIWLCSYFLILMHLQLWITKNIWPLISLFLQSKTHLCSLMIFVWFFYFSVTVQCLWDQIQEENSYCESVQGTKEVEERQTIWQQHHQYYHHPNHHKHCCFCHHHHEHHCQKSQNWWQWW